MFANDSDWDTDIREYLKLSVLFPITPWIYQRTGFQFWYKHKNLQKMKAAPPRKSLSETTKEELKLRHLAATNGIAQIKHLIDAIEGKHGVLFWSVVLLACIGAFLYHSIILYQEFRKNDLVTDAEVHNFYLPLLRCNH